MTPPLYLETSVVSAYVDDRLPERRRATVDFWDRLHEYQVSISELTLREIQEREDPDQRAEMLRLVRPFAVWPIAEEARRLAREYVQRGVFSPGAADDALHVALAVTSRQQILVRWNFRHLVNRRRRALINEGNVLGGYPPLEILSPPEV
jgi:hypothetical protein